MSSTACNSDVPVSATATFVPYGTVTVTRVATHPLLPRYNLRLTIQGAGICRAETELFPDTGHVSRRNVYEVSQGLLYVIGQYDARVVDFKRCLITLSEFRSLEPDRHFLGSFDVDERNAWIFLPMSDRQELPFEKS